MAITNQRRRDAHFDDGFGVAPGIEGVKNIFVSANNVLKNDADATGIQAVLRVGSVRIPIAIDDKVSYL
jgi:hypothetical protein